MRKRNAGSKRGFVMLEAMIIVMVFLALSAALTAAAGILYRKTLRQAERKEAYYGALAAVRMMADQVLETGNEDGEGESRLSGDRNGKMTAEQLTEPPGLEETEARLTAELPDGTLKTMTVVLSSERDGDTLVLKARAAVGEEEGTAVMKLERSSRVVPEYPFGSGLLGTVEIIGNSTVSAGPDTDLFLRGIKNPENRRWLLDVWGNLAADGTELFLEEARVGGMIISNDTVVLNRCVVGNCGSRRMGGIAVSGSLFVTDSDIYGDVLAEQAEFLGDCLITGSVRGESRSGEESTVWDHEGTAFDIPAPAAGYGGELQTSDTLLRNLVPGEDRIFVPQISGEEALPGMRIRKAETGVRIQTGEISGIAESGGDAMDPDEEGPLVRDLIFLEKGAELSLTDGCWPVYIYGEGTVRIQGNVTVYGGIQAEQIVLQDAALEIRRGKPACDAALPPVSASGYGEWVPVEYGGSP